MAEAFEGHYDREIATPNLSPATRSASDATQVFVVGDADTILARVGEYVGAGVSKFVLRPLGGDDDTILAQTRLLIEQVLPRAEARWPKRPKTITTDR